jgi:CheY-like chemotaxis protein
VISKFSPGKDSRRHILVADDNAVNTKVAARLLQMLGHTAEFVADGAAAVALAGSKRFDIILMDCQMPGMDGMEATKEIRAKENGVRTPIIAVTASALEDERRRCFEAGMDDILPKPFKKEELESMLGRWLLAGGPVSIQ